MFPYTSILPNIATPKLQEHVNEVLAVSKARPSESSAKRPGASAFELDHELALLMLIRVLASRLAEVRAPRKIRLHVQRPRVALLRPTVRQPLK